MPVERWLVLVCLALAASCNRAAPPAQQVAAAKVAAPIKEAELTTITLTPEAEKRLGIETAAIAVQQVPRIRSVGGEVVVVPGASVKVSAPVAGTLEASGGVPPPGSAVRRGQVIFRLIALAPAERDASIDAVREVDDAEARAAAAAQKWTRAEQLLRDGAGSRRALEEARTENDMAQAALKAAKARAAVIRRGPIASGGLDISSPLSGTLVALAATPGQTVAASTPLFEVARVNPLWVKVPLYAGDVGTVDAAQPAQVTGLDASHGTPRVARRVMAPPSANPEASSVDVFYEVANADGALRPGQRVGVRLPLQGSSSSLAVPKSALLHDASGGTWVYESRGNYVYSRRRVDISDIVGDLAIVARGPSPGTRVVTVGAAELFGTEFGSK